MVVLQALDGKALDGALDEMFRVQLNRYPYPQWLDDGFLFVICETV